MNKNIRNILNEKIIRINLSKREILYKILKSINQNNNIQNSIKIYNGFLINKINKNKSFLSRTHKICLSTGKRGGLFKNFSFSRYIIKDLILKNRFTNLKKNNW